MPIVKCPSCQAKYDPGIGSELKDLPSEMSMKVVCPSCGQWLRLPEKEKIDPPDTPASVLRELKSQSRLVEEKSSSRKSRDDEYEDDRPRSSRRRDDDDEPPRRRLPRDEDDDDRPGAHRGYDDQRDDYDDSPPRKRSSNKPGDGLAIASMIVGIIALVIGLFLWCCCSYFGTGLSVLLGIVAVVLGFIARSQGSQSGMGLAGIITGFAAILIGIILTVMLILGLAWVQANQGKFGPGAGGGAAPPGNQNRF